MSAAVTAVPPNPGSRKARLQGCTCPVWDNAHGKGYAITEAGPIFVMSAGCPLHGLPSERDREKRNGSVDVKPSR